MPPSDCPTGVKPRDRIAAFLALLKNEGKRSLCVWQDFIAGFIDFATIVSIYQVFT
jgi:hypothetical protein